MNLAQAAKIVHVMEAEDHGGGISGDSVNMSRYNHGCWIFTFGEMDGGPAYLTMESGGTDGTETTAETFRYRLTASELRTATGDQLGSESTSANLALTAASYEDFMLVVEMDTDELTEDQPFMTPVISAAATNVFVACVCVLTEARYLKDVPAAAIPEA